MSERRAPLPPRDAGTARKDAALATFAGELHRHSDELADRDMILVPIGWLRAARNALIVE